MGWFLFEDAQSYTDYQEAQGNDASYTAWVYGINSGTNTCFFQ